VQLKKWFLLKKSQPHPSKEVPLALRASSPKTIYDRHSWTIFFEDFTNLSGRITSIIIGVLAFAFILVVLIAFKFDENWNIIINTDFLKKDVPILFFSSLLSIASAAFAAYLINSSNISRLKSIRDLADDSLLRSFFAQLSRYDGIYEAEKDIKVRFRKVPQSDEVILADVEMAYYTFFRESFKAIEIVFLRTSEKDYKNQRTDLDADADGEIDDPLRYAWFYNSDETRLRDIINIDDKDNLKSLYSVNDFEINHNPVLPNRLIQDDRINRILYSYKPEAEPSATKPVHVSFKMTFPVERAGFNYFSVRFPTHIFKLSVDWTEIADLVEIYVVDLLNPNNITARPPTKHSASVRTGYSGWIFPKSSVLITRYRKRAGTQKKGEGPSE
jgi:hypothetical protein